MEWIIGIISCMVSMVIGYCIGFKNSQHHTNIDTPSALYKRENH